MVCFVAVRVPSVVDGTCTWREGRWTRVPSWAVPPPIKVSKSPVTQVVRQSVLRIDVEGVNLWEKLTNLRLQMRRGKVTQLPEARAPLTRLHHPVWSHNQIFSNFFWGGSRIFVKIKVSFKLTWFYNNKNEKWLFHGDYFNVFKSYKLRLTNVQHTCAM